MPLMNAMQPASRFNPSLCIAATFAGHLVRPLTAGIAFKRPQRNRGNPEQAGNPTANQTAARQVRGRHDSYSGCRPVRPEGLSARSAGKPAIMHRWIRATGAHSFIHARQSEFWPDSSRHVPGDLHKTEARHRYLGRRKRVSMDQRSAIGGQDHLVLASCPEQAASDAVKRVFR